MGQRGSIRRGLGEVRPRSVVDDTGAYGRRERKHFHLHGHRARQYRDGGTRSCPCCFHGQACWSSFLVAEFNEGMMRGFTKILTNKVKIRLDTREFLAGLVDVSVDPGGESGKLGQQIDGILIGVGPVVGFLDTLLVCGSEGTVMVESSDTHAELSHGVQSRWEATEILSSLGPGIDCLRRDTRVNEFLDKLGKFSTLRKLVREGTDLFWGRNLSGEQEPEHALGDDLLATCGGRELFLAIWNGQSVETDTLATYVRNLTDNSMRYARASFGSRTEPSQRRALRPRMPPMRFSTWSKLRTCTHVKLKGRRAYFDFANDCASMLSFLSVAL